MTTLQRWIVERKVISNDEISKTGATWRRLGDISELAPFFMAVDQPAPPTPLMPNAGAVGGARWEGQPQSLAHVPSGAWQMGAPQVPQGPAGPTQMRAQTGSQEALDSNDDTDADLEPSGGKMKWVDFTNFFKP